MTRTHRTCHRQVWLAFAVLLPAVLLIGIRARQAIPLEPRDLLAPLDLSTNGPAAAAEVDPEADRKASVALSAPHR